MKIKKSAILYSMIPLPPQPKKSFVEHTTSWVGSTKSLLIHTTVFVGAFAIAVFEIASWDRVLLVLTTMVSLEAIYLSIFIQMSVNRHQKELEEVSEDVEEIQEDIIDIGEDIEELGEDVEDIQEDIEEMTEDEDADEVRKKHQLVTLEKLTLDVQKVLNDIEALKKK